LFDNLVLRGYCVGYKALVKRSILADHNYTLLNSRVFVDCGFYFAKFDSVASNFDLIVSTT